MARRRYNRGWDYFKTGLFFALVAIAAAYFSQLAEQRFEGAPRVIDGDSLEMNAVEMRLEGIDAPELRQTCERPQVWPCGRAARDHLATLLGRGAVECTGGERDQYERMLVRCSAGAVDINATMVRDGFAVSFGYYERLESQARDAKLGLWQGEFERPSEWRAARRGEVTIEQKHASNLVRKAVERLQAWWSGNE